MVTSSDELYVYADFLLQQDSAPATVPKLLVTGLLCMLLLWLNRLT